MILLDQVNAALNSLKDLAFALFLIWLWAKIDRSYYPKLNLSEVLRNED